MTKSNIDNDPIPPKDCTCGALWSVRGEHGKGDCPMNGDGDGELKIYKKGIGTIYGIPEVSSAMAAFESSIMDLWNSKLDRSGKAWSKYQDRIRMEFVERVRDWAATLQREAELRVRIQELNNFSPLYKYDHSQCPYSKIP